MPRIVIFQGDGRACVAEVTDSATLGRSSDNTIPLIGKQISRLHARILRKGSDFFLKDTGSRNGVFVNGTRIQEHRLGPGDRVDIGTATLIYDPEFEFRSHEEGEGGIVLLPEDDPPVRMPPSEGADLLEETQVGPGVGEEALKEAHRRLQAIYEISSTLSAILDEKQLVERLLDLTLDILRAERAAILYCAQDGSNLRPAGIRRTGEFSATIPVSRTILRQVLERRQAILSEDASSDPRFEASQSLRLDNITSVLCAPLVGRDALLGAIYVDTRDLLRTFDRGDLSLLGHIARQSGMALANARAYTRTREEVRRLRRTVQRETLIVGESPSIRNVLMLIQKVAATDSTVLITGETGTGKELVARRIHEESARRSGQLVPVDCTAISPNLLESELFGHEKGAFTGADKMKPGKFEVAGGGTIFLDEIGDMDPSTQTKLLRFLEDRSFTRVGGVKLIQVDVRILAATNRDLRDLVEKGKFREDLYYRLAVVPIHLPSLHDRPGDVDLLVAHYLEIFSRQMGKPAKSLGDDALSVLRNYRWPGGVRELRNLVERIVVLCDEDEIHIEDLPAQVVGSGMAVEMSSLLEKDLPLAEIVARVEETCIRRAIEKARGKKIEAARILQISRPTLDKKIRDYGIEL